MTSAIAIFRVSGIGRGQLAALRKQARRMGMSTDAYVGRLIADDLKIERLIAVTSGEELSAPFQEAFKHTTEEEIGELVERARSRHGRRL
jgi:hypothetical protein